LAAKPASLMRAFSLSFVRPVVLSLVLITSCTNARLERVEEQSVALSTLGGSYCSRLGRSPSSPLKVFFVVDMSMSNIGRFQGSRFDSTSGTDLAKIRMDAIDRFVSECGASNANNEYSVIGFSNGILTSEATPNCSQPFLKTRTQITAAVQSLRQLQDDNFAYYSGRPTAMKEMAETDYSKAMDCTQQMISADLARGGTERPYYQVFFMTDGRPNPDPCAGKASCYSQKVELLVSQTASQSASMRFQPVFYGNSSDMPAALAILSPMAEAGRSEKVEVVNNLSDLKLCDLTSQPIQVRYRKEAMFAVNLTAKLERGVLRADSDMDGITDATEITLGYNPTQARTFGLLDSICSVLGGKDLCQSIRTGLICDDRLLALGLTDCDVKAMKLDTLKAGDMGVDSDGDSLPDFIEIIRESLPNYSDATSDLDQDGLTNRTEIARGSQVNFPDLGVDSRVLFSVRESLVRSAENCGSTQEAWSFDLANIPLASTQAYAETRTRFPITGPDRRSFDLSHVAGENVIAVVFKSIPENSNGSKAELWGALLKIDFNPALRASVRLRPSDFFLIGEVAQ
jgi:hypothetical protein